MCLRDDVLSASGGGVVSAMMTRCIKMRDNKEKGCLTKRLHACVTANYQTKQPEMIIAFSQGQSLCQLINMKNT